MKSQHLIRRLLPIIFVLIMANLGTVTLGQTNFGGVSTPGLFQSPISTLSSTFDSPLPVPSPSKPAFSEAAQSGSAYISERENIPVEALIITADHPTEYPDLGRKFQVVTLLDTRPEGQVYKLLVDWVSGQIEEDISVLLAAESQAYQAHYGKLEPILYERLQTLKDNDTVPVAVWIATQPGKTLAEQQQSAFVALAAKYPEARVVVMRLDAPPSMKM